VAHLDEPVTEGRLAHHDDMVRRRVAGEPLQYTLGRWGFRHLDLAVDPRALIPRPETEQVVEVGLAELDRLGVADRELDVVDLGTGTGAIALSVATERLRTRVWAVDLSPDALALARANLAGIGRPAARVRMLEGRWFDPLPDELRGTVALVISNPPYVPDGAELPPAVQQWEPEVALRSGPNGLDDIAVIVAAAGEWLMPGGALVVELDPSQADAAQDLARQAGLCDVTVAPDLSSRARALRARRPA
jgi:release factor glutamine methyltransferase